jgi:UDP-glucose 4-epimerase
MNILVTGGAGFIGSHVADAYSRLGHRVVIIDDLSSGSLNNVASCANFVRLSVLDREGLAELFRRERFQVVNNHAAQTSVPASVVDPVGDAQINIVGLLHLLEACRLTGVEKFIHVSSGGAVYGENAPLPVCETEPCMPLSPYGISKAATEDYLRFYHQIHGVDYTSLRYSNVFGPRQMPHGESSVVPTFILQMMRGEAPTIYGDGSMLRDYTYVDDIVRANIVALAMGSGQCYNIGTGKPTSVLTVYNAVAAELGFTGSPQFAPARPGDLQANWLACDKARNDLGWSATTDLEAGIHLTASYFRRAAA